MSQENKIKPRSEISRFQPYLPGRSMEQVKKMYKLKKVIKLASNENPLGPSPRAVKAIQKAAPLSHRYPDGFSSDLRETLSRYFKLKLSQIILGAGSDEIIELLAKSYLNPDDNIVVSEHAFIRYQMAADLMGAKTISVPMKNHTHDLEGMLKEINSKTKFVFIANPNNPTGTYNTKIELESFLNRLPNSVLPVLDEAYFEYACLKKDYPDGIHYFKKGKPLMVLRTFSKIHGLAGLRLGYGVAPLNIVETLERMRPPFNISTSAQAAGVAALSDRNQIRRSAKLNQTEMKKMEQTLKKLKIEWIPSAGNFLLINVFPSLGREITSKLLRKGVIVRAMDEYGLENHFRVSIGLPHENKIFIKAFSGIMKEVLTKK